MKTITWKSAQTKVYHAPLTVFEFCSAIGIATTVTTLAAYLYYTL